MATLANYLGAHGCMVNNGPQVKDINTERTRIITTLPANLDAEADIYETANNVENRRDCTELLNQNFHRSQLDTLASINRLGQVIEKRLQDRPTMLTPLSVETENIERILDRMIEDLYGNETIKANVFAVGSVTAGSGNVGNGSVLIDKKLDGVSQPCQRYRPHRRYLNVDSELAIAETLYIVCVVDSHGQVLSQYSANAPGRLLQPNFIVGNEQFYICGKAPPANRISSNPRWGSGYGTDSNEGSGSGPIFYAIDVDLGTPETTFIGNRGFENWSTTDVPRNWTDLVTGAATSAVFNDTSVKFTGSSSLRFTGDTTAEIARGQYISPQYLIGNKRYYVSFWMRGEAGATGTVNVLFTGTSYTASSTEKVSEAAPTSTTWVHRGFYITLPSTIPTDWLLKISVSGTPATGKSTWFDAFNFRPVDWHGGINMLAYNGSIPPAVGDYWTIPITQSATGVWQEFHKRWFGVQLPSNAAAGETIGDALAS